MLLSVDMVAYYPTQRYITKFNMSIVCSNSLMLERCGVFDTFYFNACTHCPKPITISARKHLFAKPCYRQQNVPFFTDKNRQLLQNLDTDHCALYESPDASPGCDRKRTQVIGRR